MAVIRGLQICTPVARPRAAAVLGGMVQLLALRRVGKIKRSVFLVKWGKLRKALLITDDYQELRRRIAARADGTCEACGKASGQHVHHKVPVAFSPYMALMDSNCLYLCKGCHEGQDQVARERAIKNSQEHYVA